MTNSLTGLAYSTLAGFVLCSGNVQADDIFELMSVHSHSNAPIEAALEGQRHHNEEQPVESLHYRSNEQEAVSAQKTRAEHQEPQNRHPYPYHEQSGGEHLQPHDFPGRDTDRMDDGGRGL